MKAQALFILALCALSLAQEDELPSPCDVKARTQSGMVCGRIRSATDGTKYASFRGIRYAKAPLGELRFAPPQKPDPFENVFNASEYGPVCPQIDPVYGPIYRPLSMDEDCLRINVHVPLNSLPDPDSRARRGIPVMVFDHGGSFSYGSGDGDLHGPEFLMADQGIAFVTFNYRINVFGFLSLQTEKIPGNTGLRDSIFALQWVQDNIEFFGGDPNEVTYAGQSAGAAKVSLLASSPATKDRKLFKRVACLSGNSLSNFFSISQSYSELMKTLFLIAAGINVLQSNDGIHKDLIEAPVDRLIRANKVLLDIFGLASFAPVIEETHPNLTAIIPKDPEILIKEGYGKEYPTLLGYTSNEVETFRGRLVEVNFETKIRLLNPLTLPLNLLFTSSLLSIPVLTVKQMIEYFDVAFVTLERFLPAVNDQFFIYPALRLTKLRLASGAENTFVYQFGFAGEESVFREVQGRNWTGAGHVEDLTFICKVNSILGNRSTVNELTQNTPDSKMRKFMVETLVHFIKNGRPARNPLLGRNRWPATGEDLKIMYIDEPGEYNFTDLSPYMKDKVDYFDRLYSIGRGNVGVLEGLVNRVGDTLEGLLGRVTNLL